MAKSAIITALEGLQSFRGDYTNEQKRQIESLYKQVFREVFVATSCTNCYHDAVDKMWAYIRKHGDVMPEREFVLKYGAVINIGGFGEAKFYIRHTLTDELAVQYLRKNPSGIREFESYPKDWRTRIAEEEVKQAVISTRRRKK